MMTLPNEMDAKPVSNVSVFKYFAERLIPLKMHKNSAYHSEKNQRDSKLNEVYIQKVQDLLQD